MPAVASTLTQCCPMIRFGARISFMSADDLTGFMHELRIQRMPFAADAAIRHRFENRATGLMQVMAIVEPAVRQQRPELWKRALQPAFGQMMQAEFLEARRVDQRAAFAVRAVGQRIETREGRRMAP